MVLFMIDHVIPHDLDPATLRQVADQAIAWYQDRYAKYQPQVEWVSETAAALSFSAKGFTVTGTVDLREHDVFVSLKVPLFLRMFRAQAIQKIDAEMQRWLAQANVSTAVS